MRAIQIVLPAALLGAALVTGCEQPGSTRDASIVLPDAADTAACGEPGAPYGTSEGSHFLPFTLPRCDGTPYAFYGEAEGFCDASFTVVAIAAGWCGPCRTEANLMEARLVQEYADRGVRVVVAIIQDNDFRAATPAFCDGWVTQYGLTNPVLLDAAQETQIYFPGDSLPATLVVDSEGVIQHREYGVSTDLETTRAALDRLLAGG